MNLVSVPIDEFPNDGAPWRIDGLGRLHSTGSSLSESLVDVHLSELKPYYQDPLKNGSLAKRTKRVAVKVGFMALLKPGSVWINKERRLPKLPPKTMNVRVAPEQVELRTWGSTVELEGHTIPLIAKNQFYVPTDNWRDLAESWVVFIRRPLPNVPYLVIPSSVIFQKCLAVSPEGIRRLVGGELHRIIDNPHSVDAGDDVESFFVELAKEIPSAHAYAYANLAADPNGKREYERMRRTLVAASVNEDRGRNRESQSFLNLGLPFSNPVSMHLHGKLMPYRKNRFDNKVEFAFLATEIVSLDVQLVFDRLIVHRKNSGDKGENAGDADLKEGWAVPKTKSLDLNDDAVVPATSDSDPLSELEKLIVEETGGFNALNLEVIKNPKLTQKYRSSPNSGRGSVEFDDRTTTGDSRSGNQGPADLDVDVIEAPRVPVTLDSFIDTRCVHVGPVGSKRAPATAAPVLQQNPMLGTHHLQRQSPTTAQIGRLVFGQTQRTKLLAIGAAGSMEDAQGHQKSRVPGFVESLENHRLESTQGHCLKANTLHAGMRFEAIQQPGRRVMINVAVPDLSLAAKVRRVEAVDFESVVSCDANHPG